MKKIYTFFAFLMLFSGSYAFAQEKGYQTETNYYKLDQLNGTWIPKNQKITLGVDDDAFTLESIEIRADQFSLSVLLGIKEGKSTVIKTIAPEYFDFVRNVIIFGLPNRSHPYILVIKDLSPSGFVLMSFDDEKFYTLKK